MDVGEANKPVDGRDLFLLLSLFLSAFQVEIKVFFNEHETCIDISQDVEMTNRYMKDTQHHLSSEKYIKTTVRHHLTPIEVSITKKSKDNK